jgi:glycosyltransferase involved in cell wall biosynthesis
MIFGKTITVIIPCKNEAAALYSMLHSMPTYVDEVIVVDNGSSDNTSFVAKKHGAKVIRENRHIDGIGYGFAHQSGIKAATGDIVIGLDGDGTYPLHSIKDIVKFILKSGHDFVSCSRFPLADPDAISWIRKLGVSILNLQVSLLYGYQIQDILSGMWAFKRDKIHHLTLVNGEWNFSPEIKLEAITNPNIHFSEYHISHELRLNGFSKQNIWKTGFNHLMYILKRRITTDKVSKKQQVEFIFDSMRYALKSVLFMLLLLIRLK